MSNGFSTNRSGGAGSGSGEFRVGTIFSLTARITLAFFVPFVLTAVLAHAPLDILQLLAPSLAKAMVWFELIVSAIVGCIVTFGTLQFLRGRNFVFHDALQQTGGRFSYVIGVSVCIGIMMLVCVIPIFVAATTFSGNIALIGILGLAVAAVIVYLLIRFYVAVPVTVTERSGVFASLARAAQLSAGYRWQIFLAFFGAVIPIILAFIVLLTIAARVGPELVFCVNLVGTALIGVIGNVLAAVVYYQLRRAKEGIDIDRLASIFD